LRDVDTASEKRRAQVREWDKAGRAKQISGPRTTAKKKTEVRKQQSLQRQLCKESDNRY